MKERSSNSSASMKTSQICYVLRHPGANSNKLMDLNLKMEEEKKEQEKSLKELSMSLIK